MHLLGKICGRVREPKSVKLVNDTRSGAVKFDKVSLVINQIVLLANPLLAARALVRVRHGYDRKEEQAGYKRKAASAAK